MASRPLSPATHSAEDVIRFLRLAPLPGEGGWFRRVEEADLRATDGGRRACSTIHFLVTPESFSAMHRLDAAETWCFHAGDPIDLLLLDDGGAGRVVTLGLDVAAGQNLHALVPAGAWQGARLRAGGRWGLVSCVVAPEFLEGRLELAARAELVAGYPEFAAEIVARTR